MAGITTYRHPYICHQSVSNFILNFMIDIMKIQTRERERGNGGGGGGDQRATIWTNLLASSDIAGLRDLT